MTITSQINTWGPYVGTNTANQVFAVSDKFIKETDLAVVITDSAGLETTLTLTTHYTVTGAGEASGGTVTVLAAVPVLSTITINDEIPYVQSTALPLGGEFASTAVETALDSVVKQVQRVQLHVDDLEGGVAIPGVDYLTVDDFGASSSNNAVLNTLAFQAALDSGLTMRIPSANYLVTIASLTFANSVWIYADAGAQVNGVTLGASFYGDYFPNVGGTVANLGPMFINGNKSATATGEVAGLKINVNDITTATPDVGDVALQVVITARNSRGPNGLWGADIACLQGADGNDGNTWGIECELSTSQSTSTEVGSWSFPQVGGGFHHQGLAVVHHTDATELGTVGLSVWAAEATGVGWWNAGIGISRCKHVGLEFVKDPYAAGSDATIEAFAVAAIYDRSESIAVLKIDGIHNQIIDLSGMTQNANLVLGNASGSTLLKVTNAVDELLKFRLDAGTSATQVVSLEFADQTVGKWEIIKSATNELTFFDNTRSISAMRFNSGDASNAVELFIGGSLQRVSAGANDSGATASTRMLEIPNA